MKPPLVSRHNHLMNNFIEETPATKFNEIILRDFERPCQISGVRMILSRESRVDLIIGEDGKLTTLTDAVKFAQKDLPTKVLLLTTRRFKSRKDFQVVIVDEIMSNKVELLIFKLDDNGFIEIVNDNEGCTVRMHTIPREMGEKLYQKDITTTHAGTMNIFQGRPDITNIEFLPDKKGLIISFQKASNAIYGNGRSVPDKVWQEKHEIVDGVLVHTETRYGQHHPQEMIQEHITWDKEWNKVTRQ